MIMHYELLLVMLSPRLKKHTLLTPCENYTHAGQQVKHWSLRGYHVISGYYISIGEDFNCSKGELNLPFFRKTGVMVPYLKDIIK